MLDRPMMARVEAAVARLTPTAVELTSQLVKLPSDAPANDERAVVAALQRAAGKLKLPAGDVIAAEPTRPNLVIRLRGKAGGRRLVLNAHTDTKPPGLSRDWGFDPPSGLVRGGSVHGLGSADAKGAIAAMVVAAGVLKALDLPLSGELILVFGADEEATGALGLGYVLDATDLQADAAIIGEPSGLETGFDSLSVGSRGFLGFTLTALGRRVHSGLAGREGTHPEAVRMLARAIDELPHVVDFGTGPTDAFPLGPALTFTSLAGGIASGILPAQATAQGEVRTVPGQSAEATFVALRRALGAIRARDGSELIVRLDEAPGLWPASSIDPDHEIVRILGEATTAVVGRSPRLSVFPGATEAHFFSQRGIACVPGYGPGRLAAAHVPNESVAVAEIKDAVGIYARAAAAYLHG